MRLGTLGARLKHTRKARGLTQEQLAQMVGTTQDVIQKIENEKSLRPRNIEKIAQALEVSPAWLQFGIEELDKLNKEAVEVALAWSELTPGEREYVKKTILSLHDK